MKQAVKNIFDELFERYPELEVCKESVMEAYDILYDCYSNGGTVLVCGNGGSAADSEHIVGELMKGFILKRQINKSDKAKLASSFPEEAEYFTDNLQSALPAISLVSQTAISTAFSNDVSPDMVYAQQVYGYIQPGDVLIALSTSGNSKNVVNAVKVAKAFGGKTIGLTGQKGGNISELCDTTIKAPSDITFKIQEYHLPIYHTLCAMIEYAFFYNDGHLS